jgi:hypothetical protein
MSALRPRPSLAETRDSQASTEPFISARPAVRAGAYAACEGRIVSSARAECAGRWMDLLFRGLGASGERRTARSAPPWNTNDRDAGPTSVPVRSWTDHQVARGTCGGCVLSKVTSSSPTTCARATNRSGHGSASTSSELIGVRSISWGLAGRIRPMTRPRGSGPPIAAAAMWSQRALRASAGLQATESQARSCKGRAQHGLVSMRVPWSRSRVGGTSPSTPARSRVKRSITPAD